MSTPIAELYSEQGYFILRDTIPGPLIDNCLRALNAAKKRKSFVYYSQSTHRWITPQLSPSGFLTDSILNPSQHVQAPSLASSVRNIIYHQSVSDALSCIYPLHRDFVSWQDMLFDRSTGTIDHLDSWYLDTEVEGGLVGVWFALEDIAQQSGPFFVCPGSHKLGKISRETYPSHSSFLGKVQSRIVDHNLQRVPMCLHKGDILVWNSLLIHGAFDCQNEALSRKSLTSHYFPLGCRRSDSLSLRQLMTDLRSLRSTRNARIHRLSKFGRTPAFYAIGGPFLAIAQKVGCAIGDSWNMRRSKSKA